MKEDCKKYRTCTIPTSQCNDTCSLYEKADIVNHPPHYTQGNIEVYDFIEDQALGYEAGNIVKYICRHPHKGKPLEDLNKAKWYLDKLINRLNKSKNN